MTQAEIKEWVAIAQVQIAASEKFLKSLRSECKHPTTHEGNYSYRVGCINPATICSDCGHVIKVHFGNEIMVQE